MKIFFEQNHIFILLIIFNKWTIEFLSAGNVPTTAISPMYLAALNQSNLNILKDFSIPYW